MIYDSIKIEPIDRKTVETYIDIGTRSYKQHYLHLWENRDPSPYINESFTEEVLNDELHDRNIGLFIIYSDEAPVGILKIIIDQEVGDYSSKEALLLQKIYLLQEYSGKGIGSKALTYTENFARKQNKKVLWLDAMKKGPAVHFYLKKGFQVLKEVRHKSTKVLSEQSRMCIMTKKL